MQEDQNTNDKPERELSPGSKLRFWKQAYLAALTSGDSTDEAANRADKSIPHYNAKLKELLPNR